MNKSFEGYYISSEADPKYAFFKFLLTVPIILIFFQINARLRILIVLECENGFEIVNKNFLILLDWLDLFRRYS